MSNRTRESVIEIVKRMQAKAESQASTMAEIEAFARKANELILEYNLQASELADTPDNPVAAFINTPFTLTGNMADVEWKRQLVYTLARANFCQAVYTPKTRLMHIVGEQSNIEVVEYLYEFIWKQIQKLSRANWVENKSYAYTMNIGEGKWRVTFCNGAAHGIGDKLREERDAWTQTADNHMALVVVKDAHLAEAMSNFYPRLGRGRATTNASDAAYNAGHNAGRNMQLRRGVGTGSNNPRIG